MRRRLPPVRRSIRCPYCASTLSPNCPDLGELRRSLLDHLRACHGPLRRRDVAALLALPGPALHAYLRPRPVPPRG
jgi:hypothetical protein